MRRKEVDGYKNRSWGEWFTNHTREWSRLPTDSQRRQQETGEGLMQMWLTNFADNLPAIRTGRTIRDLLPTEPPIKPTVVVGRGPSLFKHEHAKLLAERQDKLVIVATDGTASHLMRNGCIPDYVLSVDGSDKIKPFYVSPEWSKHGKDIKIVLTVSTNHDVSEQCKSNDSTVYWVNSAWDDFRFPDSLVRWMTLMTINKKEQSAVPTLRVGTNAGQGCFSLAYAILKHREFCLVGMDMGYPANFPYDQTAYYKNAKAAGLNMMDFSTTFTHGVHPQFGPYFVDPVFRQYRQGFLDMISEIPKGEIKITNATEGGSLWFDGRIECVSLKDYLAGLP